VRPEAKDTSMKHEAQALPLFEEDTQRPLADRLRPRTLEDVVGQEYLRGDLRWPSGLPGLG
jgi:replication-associated recombination protein RarA